MIGPVAHSYGNAQVSVFYMDAGDTIPRHQHPVSHTTCVVVGRSRVDIFSIPPVSVAMVHTDPDLTLPPYVDHEITAIDEGTVVMNVLVTTETAGLALQAPMGGVTLACGCVVPQPMPCNAVKTP